VACSASVVSWWHGRRDSAYRQSCVGAPPRPAERAPGGDRTHM